MYAGRRIWKESTINMVELNNEELQVIDGGISSQEVNFVAGLCLLTLNPPVAATLLVVSYLNTKFIENCIEY